MKIKSLILLLGLLALNGWSQTPMSSFTNSTVSVIPDGSPVGVMESFNVTSLGGSITNVQVTLDITGGFNGDLYAYLVSPQGQFVVLLNRPGISGSNPFGYADAGMTITLDGLATNNIHYYGATPVYSLSGTTWAADGRNVNPQASGTVFDSTSPTAGLSLYNGVTGGEVNGTWTLFIADLSAGGGTPGLNSVILTIMTVPEPQTWVIMGCSLATLILLRRRK
jgi:subtilisin-like proprotein convertase family protein